MKETNEEVVSQSVKTDDDSDYLKRILKDGSDAICKEKAEAIIVNWKKLNNSWLFGYELLVPAKPYTLSQSEWIKDLKKNNRKQELILERDILMTKQHNEPHVQTLTRKRRNSNDGLTRNANDQEEGRFLQEEQDELGNQSGDEKDKISKKRKDCKVKEECSSILFDEKNEDSLIESIDESKLINKTRLPILKPSENISEYKLSSGGDLLTMFKKYQKSIPKCRQVTTLAYWGILDLTRESLSGCKEFSERDIQELLQDFSNTISWNLKSAPDYLQEYFNKNCEESHQIKDIKKLHTNIQFIKENMYSFNDSMTEEELKMISIFPIFRSILQLNVVKDAWGEIQVYSTKNARNENSNPFQRAHLGRKVDMKGTLKNTLNKFEALLAKCLVKKFGSLWIAPSGSFNTEFELNFYTMNWFGGLYRFGLLDHCILLSQEDDCGLFEDIYCILKELNSVKELYRSNTLGKHHRITMENSHTLNMNRTPD
ncbi:14384_t:CDS:10 [Funneliformis mosseae]|uniref:14384_t:CDS:1 n=1 Tax=Funneliformis mosseae TaxID=27381 RepID=A0A9N9ADI8_FUNMO|nr:14384_t:CDS:10 [Funneliformis mosseae]